MSSVSSESPVVVARGRLATLTAHLRPSSAEPLDLAPALEPLPLSAHSSTPRPGNLKGFLTVADERTGKKFQVEVSEEGTIRATDIKKVFSDQ